MFEGRCGQSGNARQELRMRKAALLPGVSLMETARNSFLRRQEWLLLQVERGRGASGLARVCAEHLWRMQRPEAPEQPLLPYWSKGQSTPLRPSDAPLLILFQVFCSLLRVMGTV